MERIILVVDDEPAILRALKRLLRDHWSVLATDDIEQALSWLQQYDIAVMLSDYRMPDCNGVELLTQARKISPNTHRYLLSGQADYDAVSKAISSGACERFLCKPWQNSQLLSHLEEGWEVWQAGRICEEDNRVSAAQLGSLLATGELALLYRIDISASPSLLNYCLAGPDDTPLALAQCDINETQRAQLARWAEQTVLSQLALTLPGLSELPDIQPTLDEPQTRVWCRWDQIAKVLKDNSATPPDEGKELRIL